MPQIPNSNMKAANILKGRLFAALELGLGILDADLCLIQLISVPGVVIAR